MQNQAMKFPTREPQFSFPSLFGAGKALAAGKQQAAGAGSTGQAGNLGQWLENARSYYNSVMSGQTAKPSAQEWNQFLQWMNWAATQTSGGSQWDPSGGMDPMGGMNGSSGRPQVNNYGGELGPNGSYTYDRVSTKIGFTGPNTRNDVFGTDNEINIDQASASVATEETMDQGVQVLKVTVTTSKGTAVYLYDNYKNADFKLKINVPFVDKVTGASKFPGKVEVAKFDPKAAPGESTAESSLPGVQDKLDKNTWIYKPETVGETIDFRAKPGNGNQNHIVHANANISVQPGDNVSVQRLPNDGGFDIQVKVTHEDGSSDTYTVKKGNNVQVNANLEYITIDGKSYDGKTIPAEYGPKLTLRGPGTPGPAAPPLVGTLVVSGIADKKPIYTVLKP